MHIVVDSVFFLGGFSIKIVFVRKNKRNEQKALEVWALIDYKRCNRTRPWVGNVTKSAVFADRVGFRPDFHTSVWGILNGYTADIRHPGEIRTENESGRKNTGEFVCYRKIYRNIFIYRIDEE